MPTDQDDLFDEYKRTGRRSTRNRIVEAHMGLAIHIARRFDGRTRRDGDIEQVAMLALVKAVDRFDPSMGVPFVAFAGRTIEGEIKRYFRDATWAMKVPRGAKELHLAVRKGVDQLSSALGRSPTVDEVAAHLAISRDDVITGLAAGEARSIGSIDPGPDDGASMTERMASSVDQGYEGVDNDDAVQALLAKLPEREQMIVRLRFYDELSQSEIAARVGVSQMHVSRLLRAALERLREHADTSEGT
jgi:RNA polymerase sigma-B factor